MDEGTIGPWMTRNWHNLGSDGENSFPWTLTGHSGF